MIAINARGLRVGEDHQRAKLSNHAVELIRQLRDGGMSYRAIADKFDVSHSTVWDICNFVKRASAPTRFRRVD
jgi:DNA invertase Pin-like site-specific DNA recombinase